jgi:hypothetical protein
MISTIHVLAVFNILAIYGFQFVLLKMSREWISDNELNKNVFRFRELCLLTFPGVIKPLSSASLIILYAILQIKNGITTAFISLMTTRTKKTLEF